MLVANSFSALKIDNEPIKTIPIKQNGTIKNRNFLTRISPNLNVIDSIGFIGINRVRL
jgi:hypothetical protein